MSSARNYNNNNMNFDPYAASAYNSDNNAAAYPTAQIVPINHDNRQEAANQFPAAQVSVAAEPYSYQNYQQPQGNYNNGDGIASSFASAQVVEPDYNSPFQNDYYATETHATATPLDPWSKTTTTSTDLIRNGNTSSSPSSGQQQHHHQQQQHHQVSVVQPDNIIPLFALEDPMHKKFRRRRRRRGRMVLSGVAGFVVGSFAGPLGALAGAGAGAALARAASKAGEKNKDRRVQHQMDQNFQQHQQQVQLNRSQQIQSR